MQYIYIALYLDGFINQVMKQLIVFFMFLVACLEDNFTEKDTFW